MSKFVPVPGSDVGASEAARAVAYALGGGAALKFFEVALRAFGVTKKVQSTELTQTLEAAAELREELRKDNVDLRTRLAAALKDAATANAEAESLRDLNDELREKNEDLKAKVRVFEMRESGRNGR